MNCLWDASEKVYYYLKSILILRVINLTMARYIYLFLISLLILLSGCSNILTDNEKELSEALKEHQVWFQVKKHKGELTRYSKLERVFYFQDEKVTVYNLIDFNPVDFLNREQINVNIERIVDKSDKEVLQLMNKLVKEKGVNFNNLFQEQVNYSFDINLDDKGQTAISESLYLPIIDGKIPVKYRNDNKLKGQYSIPNILESSFQEKIFETNFSGYEMEDDRLLITKVESDNTIFKLDKIENEKDNVTVNKGKPIDPARMYESVTFNVLDDGNEIGEFTIDLNNLKNRYKLNENDTIELNEYYPEFEFVDGVPKSKTKYPRNPAFIFVINVADKEEVHFLYLEDYKYKAEVSTENNQLQLEMTDTEYEEFKK